MLKTMSRTLATAALLACASPSLFAEGVTITGSIPQDALFAVWADSVPELKTAATNSPYGRLWDDPACSEMRATAARLYEQLLADLPEAKTDRMDEVAKLFTGAAALYYVAPAGANVEEGELSFLIQLDEAGKTWVAENGNIFGDEMKNVTRSSFEVLGTTVYRMEGDAPVEGADDLMDSLQPELDEDGNPIPTPAPETERQTISWAVAGDLLYFTTVEDKDQLSGQLALVKGENQANITTRKDAPPATRHFASKPGGVSLYIGIEPIIEAAMREAELESPGITEKVRAAGGFDLKGVWGSFVMEPKKVTGFYDLTLTDGTRGVADAVLAPNSLPLTTLAYAPNDVLSAAAYHLDLGRIYDSIVTVMESSSPGSTGMVNMSMISIQSQYGVNPLDSILKNIGGEHLFVTKELAPELQATLTTPAEKLTVGQAAILGLRNPDETFAAAKTLLTALKADPNYGNFFELEEVGADVILIKPSDAMTGESALKPAFAVTRKGLILANNDILLQELVRGVSGQLTNTLATKPEVAAQIAATKRDGLLAFTYSSKDAAETAVGQFRSILEMGIIPEEFEVSPEAIPSAEVIGKYIGDSWGTGHREENVLRFDGVMLAP